MTVAVVGTGPAAGAVAAALADVGQASVETSPSGIADARLGVVVAGAGESTFDRANAVARESSTPWFAVELGGVGGYGLVDAAVSGFAPETACYACLRTRIAAAVEEGADDAVPTPDRPTARLAGAVAGRAAADVLNGDPEPFGRVRELPHAIRRLLPVPYCECGPGPDRRFERTVGDRDLEAALAAAEQGLDERVGIVSEVGEVESFPAPYYLARGCETSGFSDVAADREAAAVAVDWNESLMKALGEALERYCAGVYRTASFTRSSPDALAGAVPPSAFVLPDDPDVTDERAWIGGGDLHTGRSVWLPAELVVYPPHEQCLRPPITTGLGLGNGTVGALLSGLYEVIERDATMLAWYSTFEPLGLTVADEGYRTLADRVRAASLSVTPLLVSQDVDVPVVAVAVHRDGEWPAFALGSAATLDPSVAARSALAEAIQNWLELRAMGPEEAREAGGAIGEYAEFPDRAAAFVDVDATVSAEEVGPDAVPESQAELDAVLDRCSAAGLDVHAVRLTTRDLTELGFECVRVLSPSAQPLFLEEPYFGERARTVPGSLGFEPRLDREHHPFP